MVRRVCIYEEELFLIYEIRGDFYLVRLNVLILRSASTSISEARGSVREREGEKKHHFYSNSSTIRS